MNTQVLLVKRPVGIPDVDQVFKVVREKVPEVTDGKVLVRQIFMGLDPAMRGWMDDRKSYLPPVALGDVMRSGGVGEVVESKSPLFVPGDKVTGLLGWQEYAIRDGKDLTKVPNGVPLQLTQSVLGTTGLTAYFGFFEVGKPVAGNTVLVSGAAGATGSVVVQLAKISGCRVVAVAGAEDKCKWLKEIGADEVINYRTTKNLAQDVYKATPKGIDIFFDNVGGEILDIALARLNMRARIVVCGGISQYNATQKVGPSNYLNLIATRSKMEGFLVFDYSKKYPEAIQKMSQWIKEGKLQGKEDIVDGIENAPKTFLKLFDGSNTGKLLIRVSPERSERAHV